MSTKEKSGEEATDEDGDNSITTTQLQRPITLCKRKLGHAPRSICIDAIEKGEKGSGNEAEKSEDSNHPLSSAEACILPQICHGGWLVLVNMHTALLLHHLREVQPFRRKG